MLAIVVESEFVSSFQSEVEVHERIPDKIYSTGVFGSSSLLTLMAPNRAGRLSLVLPPARLVLVLKKGRSLYHWPDWAFR